MLGKEGQLRYGTGFSSTAYLKIYLKKAYRLNLGYPIEPNRVILEFLLEAHKYIQDCDAVVSRFFGEILASHMQDSSLIHACSQFGYRHDHLFKFFTTCSLRS